MALPTLDATFASSADLPRKQMLAKWLVEELGETQAPSDVLISGIVNVNATGKYVRNGEQNGRAAYFLNGTDTSNSQSYLIWTGSIWVIEELEYGGIFYSSEDVEFPWLVTSWTFGASETSQPTVTESPAPSPLSNYYSLPERYLWAKIAVAAGAPKTEADYISLPKNYVWSDIYNAVAGSSGPHIDWSENVALGHIAAAYRGDTGNPANLATYIDWPWRYKVASIIGGIAPSGPTFPSDGLLAFWNLNDLTDASGNGNNLVNTGDVQFVSGKIENCADFDTSNYLSNSSLSTAFNPSQEFTVAMWVYPRSFTDYQSFICGEAGTLNIHLDSEGGLYCNNGAAADVLISSILQLNSWQHIVFAVGSNRSKVWINGINVFDQEKGVTYDSSTGFNLGIRPQLDFNYDGKLDAFGLWNKELTQSEINLLYNSGNGLEKN